MLRKIAQVFSICFHPLLMPTIGIVILMYTDSYLAYIPFQAKKMLIILTSVGTLALPALMMPMFLLQGKITDFQLDERKERLYPMFMTSVFYLLTFFLFKRIPVFGFLHAFILGSFISVILASVITIKWKISTHMIGLGGLTGLILTASFKLNLNLFYPLLGLLIASGLTASSRIYLKAHNPDEVYIGYMLGIVVITGSLFLY